MSNKMRTTLLCASLLGGGPAVAATSPLVTGAINEGATVAITGERSPALAGAQDLGAFGAGESLPHVMLVLKRPAQLQAALDQLMRDQQDRRSPSYHKWLSPGDLRAFGPAQADIDVTVAWLRSHGLTINEVAPSGMSIDFAGPAVAIGAAFHTTLHHVSLNGEAHIANVSDLAIPAALAPVVRGATLSNFFPTPNMVKHPQFTVPVSGGAPYYAVGPQDFSKIYNMNTLFNGNSLYGVRIAGFGVTVAVVEQTDILPADWATFRHAFQIDRSRGTLTLQHPHCADPGFTFDEGEAALDAEWSSATAPDASIIEASCPGSATTFGVETALQQLVERGTTASVLSISYGGNEINDGLVFLAGWENLVQEGAAEGLSIMISSGDAGVSAVRNSISYAGLAVNGLSSNAYNTTLGGTDFYDTALKQNGRYWLTTNKFGLRSAVSYIPEIPWDNSCASSVIATFNGAADAVASCNVSPFPPYEQQGVGGTGGQSLIYAKPDFQKIGVPGMPTDGVRDQPDISLFSANGTWSHFLVFCMSDPRAGGTACDYSVTNDVFGNAAGGTSFAAPAFAGVMALVVQTHSGARLGNAAPRLYAIAKAQFTTPYLVTGCNATRGNHISTACVFNNVTVGNIAEPCYAGTTDCYTNANSTNRIGVLRAKGMAVDAFPAQPGYSLATGLGSLNVQNLLYNY